MANLARANPALGRHLAATIRTLRSGSTRPDRLGALIQGSSAPGLNNGAPGLNATPTGEEPG